MKKSLKISAERRFGLTLEYVHPPKVREKTITKTKNTHRHIPRSLTFLLNQFNIPLGSLQHYKSQIFLNIRTTIETPKNGGTLIDGATNIRDANVFHDPTTLFPPEI